MDTIIEQSHGLVGEIEVPGDKSISHRGVLFGALATGTTQVDNFLMGADCLSSIRCLEGLGVSFKISETSVVVNGVGKYGLQEPPVILDAGNSGTTTRLLLGILAGQPFHSVVTGDRSLCSRPMLRVVEPLRKMGATIDGRKDGQLLPIGIRGGKLQPIEYTTPVASAQIKSSLILAGLYADGITKITEPKQSRNHTELMLKHFGADIKTEGNTVTISGDSQLQGQKMVVPGDISSAAFFIVAGLIVPNSELLIKNVGINSSRNGIIRVLQEMGGDITLHNQRETGGEPVADILVKTSSLRGVEVSGEIIPTLIDEIPVLAVAAACATGTTTIRDAAELKVKESDRIATTCTELSKFGCKVEPLPDGLIVEGGANLVGSIECQSYDDHRIAMAMAICGLVASGSTKITETECVGISFPDFFKLLKKVSR